MYLIQPDQKTGLERRRILWPTDFSASAGRAFPRALALSEHTGAQLHLLHVADAPEGPDSRARWADVEKMARIKLERYRMAYRYGLPSRQVADVVLSVVCAPRPSQGIVEYAAHKSIDLIVMGTRGLAGPQRDQLGSTAAEVLGQAPCSVMVVPARQRATGLPRTILALTPDAPGRARGQCLPLTILSMLRAGRPAPGGNDGVGEQKAGENQGSNTAPIVECLTLPDTEAPVESMLEALAERETDLFVVPASDHIQGRIPEESVRSLAGQALCSVLAAKEPFAPVVTAYR